MPGVQRARARSWAWSSDDFLDLSKSLNEGAVQVPFFAAWEVGRYAASGFFDNDKKLADYTPEEMDLLLYGKGRKFKMRIGDSTMNADLHWASSRSSSGPTSGATSRPSPSARRRRWSPTSARARARCARGPG